MSGFNRLEHHAAIYKKILADGFHSGLYRYNEDGDLEKFCKDCHEYWPADDEFFYYIPRSSDKLSRSCRACFKEVK